MWSQPQIVSIPCSPSCQCGQAWNEFIFYQIIYEFYLSDIQRPFMPGMRAVGLPQLKMDNIKFTHKFQFYWTSNFCIVESHPCPTKRRTHNRPLCSGPGSASPRMPNNWLAHTGFGCTRKGVDLRMSSQDKGPENYDFHEIWSNFSRQVHCTRQVQSAPIGTHKGHNLGQKFLKKLFQNLYQNFTQKGVNPIWQRTA